MRTADPALHARRRCEIIAAAESCFLKRGFHQSSMQDIATASGLSMGLLYRYFANKEAIIAAVAEQDQVASLLAITLLPDNGNVIAALARMLQDMARSAASPAYTALAMEILAEANRSEKLKSMLQRNDRVLIEAICMKLNAQQRCGAIRALPDTVAAARALLLIFDGLTMRQFMATEKSQDLSLDQITQMVDAALG